MPRKDDYGSVRLSYRAPTEAPGNEVNAVVVPLETPYGFLVALDGAQRLLMESLSVSHVNQLVRDAHGGEIQ